MERVPRSPHHPGAGGFLSVPYSSGRSMERCGGAPGDRPVAAAFSPLLIGTVNGTGLLAVLVPVHVHLSVPYSSGRSMELSPNTGRRPGLRTFSPLLIGTVNGTTCLPDCGRPSLSFQSPTHRDGQWNAVHPEAGNHRRAVLSVPYSSGRSMELGLDGYDYRMGQQLSVPYSSGRSMEQELVCWRRAGRRHFQSPTHRDGQWNAATAGSC